MGEANSGQIGSVEANSSRGPTYRAALAAVIILGVLLVAAIVGVVFGFMRTFQIYRAARAQKAGGSAAVMELAPGARILSVKTTEGRMIVQVATPQGQEVDVMDLASGRLLYRVKTPPP